VMPNKATLNNNKVAMTINKGNIVFIVQKE
jgi:hypothetical protein